MSDMLSTITPKSDQLNAEDFIGKESITIKITSVKVGGSSEQPVSIFYDGDNGKPYKACKSMRRLLVYCWGNDSKAYIGRSITLFRDEKVKWAGAEVGGIRISHLSHIKEPMTIALSASKGNRRPYTVKPLEVENGNSLEEIEKILRGCKNINDLRVAFEKFKHHSNIKEITALKDELKKSFDGTIK